MRLVRLNILVLSALLEKINVYIPHSTKTSFQFCWSEEREKLHGQHCRQTFVQSTKLELTFM
jgi:hypothetical protein